MNVRILSKPMRMAERMEEEQPCRPQATGKLESIFLDMDGVLADFVGAVCKAHNRPDPYLDKANLGIFWFDKIWGMSQKDFFEPCNFDFWRKLEPTREYFRIVQWAVSKVGTDNVAILTSPSQNHGCVEGKREWIKEHIPVLAGNIIFTSAKKFMSGAGRHLVDDADHNVEAWVKSGGSATLLPRPWNTKHGAVIPECFAGDADARNTQ